VVDRIVSTGFRKTASGAEPRHKEHFAGAVSTQLRGAAHLLPLCSTATPHHDCPKREGGTVPKFLSSQRKAERCPAERAEREQTESRLEDWRAEKSGRRVGDVVGEQLQVGEQKVRN